MLAQKKGLIWAVVVPDMSIVLYVMMDELRSIDE
jgi:hypothetical protein